MLKILHSRFHQDVNSELPDVSGGFQRGRGTRDQIPNIRCIMEKAQEFQKNIYFCFIKTVLKPLTVWITTNYGKFLEMGIPDHLICLLRNLYVGQETVRTRHGNTNSFKIEKGVQ